MDKQSYQNSMSASGLAQMQLPLPKVFNANPTPLGQLNTAVAAEQQSILGEAGYGARQFLRRQLAGHKAAIAVLEHLQTLLDLDAFAASPGAQEYLIDMVRNHYAAHTAK